MVRSDYRRRYREIGRVLARHGFEWLWSKWGIETVLGKAERPHAEPASARSQPENLRLALEELGTTFIKLGQTLSTRPDLLPPDYIAELTKLQDHVPKVAFDSIASTIQTEFGKEPSELFQSFDPDARAAGSIAQVHGASLPDGTKVVVKVRRPDIQRQIEEDLAILGHIARFLAQNTELGKRHDLPGLLDEFAYSLRNELDFVLEGQNAERIAAQFVGDPSLHVPTIYWDFSSHAVLTMEEIGGIKISDLAALDAAGIDRKELARRCAHFALVQVLQKGFFHADPHPGNFFVEPDGAIALLDYGMVGRLDDRQRRSLLRISIAISRRDTERLIDELLTIGAAKGSVDRNALSRDLEHMLSRYDGLSLGETSAAQVFRDIASISQKSGLTLPSDLIVLARVVAMDEGLGAMLDPDFKLLEFAQPYLKQFWLENHSFGSTAERIREGVIDFADIAQDLPERLRRRLSGLIERGEITVRSQIEVPEAFTKRIQQATNRIAISVLTAGLIIGLSVLALVYRPAGSEGFGSFLLKALLTLGMALGIWVFAAIWRAK